MKQAILLDFDGTLVNTVPILYSIYSNFLAEFGIKGCSEEFSHLNGQKLDEVVHFLKEKYQIPLDEYSCERLYYDILKKDYALQADLYEGVLDFLKIVKAKGYLLAVVTGAHREIVEKILKRLNVYHFFDAVVTLEGLTHGKPDPAIYIKALETVAVSPMQALAIEDSDNGLKAAQSAGIKTLHFGPHTNWKLITQEVLHVQDLSSRS